VKILFVDQTGQLGGGELSLLDVIRNSKHDVEIALFSDGPFRDALDKINVRVHLLSLGKLGEIRREATIGSAILALPRMIALRRELATLARGFDVIYANSQKAFLMGALARRKGQVLIWHLRDMLTAEHFSPLMRRAAVLAGNFSASAVVVNSKATRDSFIEAGGNGSKAVVVYNGLSPEPFDAVTEDAAEQIRNELGLKDKFVAGVFGRLTPWKGQHVAIDAISQLPDAHLLIVGEALFGEQAYADELRNQARSSGVEDRVHFLGFRSDIPALMKTADVVIHSSTAPEPFGRVIVEAMLAGRPVIATRAGGVVEIVEDDKTGLLVSPGSSQELSDALKRLKTDSQVSRRLASAGKEKACRVFSLDAMMVGIEKVITSPRP